jgi:hypothetical protein
MENNAVVYNVLRKLKTLGAKLSFEETKFMESFENGKGNQTNNSD